MVAQPHMRLSLNQLAAPAGHAHVTACTLLLLGVCQANATSVQLVAR